MKHWRALQEPQVRKEVEVTDEEIKVVAEHIESAEKRFQKYLREHRRDANPVEVRALADAKTATAEKVFDEVLQPTRKERIKQIAYRVELANLGWARSLTRGRLGVAIGVYDDQKAEVFRQASDIEEKLRQDIWELRKAAEKDVLELVTPDQRREANGLLGEFLVYSPASRTQKAVATLEKIADERARE